ncbi:hypothetical protein Kisp01_71840 [Kineosporia sp. NBRC 101677]|uniref:hypothetical protein n=1 Tax=Kineosporia sp. NBRC 101677 TaxID=3032197 RepID=UPI00249FC8F7|nr:hypothetical protein [Kineosporia sp. NBRC 101677]GLY20170.1 hypothetical protein Kisp01_71840 [Kineosporia sp. NBRC 101677]
MPLDNYTEILQLFAGSGQDVTNPADVITGGKEETPWIAAGGWHGQPAEGEAPDPPEWFRVMRLQYSYTIAVAGGRSRSIRYSSEVGESHKEELEHFTYFLGFDPDKSYFEAKDAPYQKFLSAPGEILLPIYLQTGNNVTSPKSLLEASTTIMATGALLQNWGHAFKQWADALDVPDSNWSGSAAGIFRRTLNNFAGRMQMINEQLESSETSTMLQAAGFQLMSTAGSLFDTFAEWATRYENSPQAALAAVWDDDIKTFLENEANWEAPPRHVAQVGGAPKIQVPGYGDPSQQAFWDQLMTNAHKRWDTYVQALNEDLTRLLPALDTAYQEAYEHFPNFFPSLPGSGAGAGAGGASGAANGNFPDWDKNGNGFPDAQENADTDGDGTKDVRDPTPNGEPYRWDANGDGNPDSQEHIDSDGDGTIDLEDKTPNGPLPDLKLKVTDTVKNPDDANGNAIPDKLEKKDTDGDGFPDLWDSTPKGEPDVKTTQGGGNGPGGSSPDLYQAGILEPGPVLGGSGGGGGVHVVPKGAKISSDGTVVGPDGQPLLDGLGEKMIVPSGSKVNADGTIITPDGSLATSKASSGLSLNGPAARSFVTSTGASGSGLDGAGGARSRTVPDLDEIALPSSRSAAGKTVMGPDGDLVLDPGGRPVVVPEGSVITPEGKITGPGGQPIVDSNGAPVSVPSGSVLTGSSAVLGPDGDLVRGADGDPIVVPEGSVITPEGVITGPGGQSITDSTGAPVTVPSGSVLTGVEASSASGSGAFQSPDLGNPPPLTSAAAPRTANSGAGLDTKIPLDEFSPAGTQVSSDLPTATHSSSSGLVPPRYQSVPLNGFSPQGSTPALDALTASQSTPVGSGGTPLSSSLSGQGTRVTSPASQMSSSSKGILPEFSPASETRPALNAEQQMMNRVPTSSNGSAGQGQMMPPMMGGGGGPGGGGPQSQNGSRKTWVTEDEDVWGTEIATNSGVLGR